MYHVHLLLGCTMYLPPCLQREHIPFDAVASEALKRPRGEFPAVVSRVEESYRVLRYLHRAVATRVQLCIRHQIYGEHVYQKHLLQSFIGLPLKAASKQILFIHSFWSFL